MMEIPRRQKYKKRKTRKNLDEIRKRSKKDVKFIESENLPKRNQKISELRYNDQITSKRLTLALFKKAVRSETITRVPPKRIDQKLNSSIINSSCNKQSLKSKMTGSNLEPAIISCNATEATKNSKLNELNDTPEGITLFSPVKNGTDDSLTEHGSEEYIHEYLALTSSSCKSSDAELENCYYEKFMNELPQYIREHFPVLTKEVFANKNFNKLKQICSENCQEIENKTGRSIGSNEFVLSQKPYLDSIIQNPMDYIQKGLSGQQSIKKQQTSFDFNNTNSIFSQFKPNTSNLFVYESPEYIYFPHKLNH